jgi:energy-coupling factor transporter ATP-binding protein EcfA2
VPDNVWRKFYSAPADLNDAVAGIFKPWPVEGPPPKDWHHSEAGTAFAHRDLLPALYELLDKYATEPNYPGIALAGPPGEGKSAMLRVLAGALQQRTDRLVIYVAGCDEWARAENPKGYYLDRVDEAVSAFLRAGGALETLDARISNVNAQRPAGGWQDSVAACEAVYSTMTNALRNEKATVRTVLIFDEVNKLVELKSERGMLLDASPFNLAGFSPWSSGTMLVSGTPLHSYIGKIAAGYESFVKYTAPLNDAEVDRWLRTPLGLAVASKLPMAADGTVLKDELWWTGGVARSLAKVGRDIVDDNKRANRTWSWSLARALERATMSGRLDDYLDVVPDRAELAQACTSMFLQGKDQVPFDGSLLRTSLLAAVFGGTTQALVCAPLNPMAEDVLWNWWTTHCADDIPRFVDLAVAQLQDMDEPARGYALQTLLVFSVVRKATHEHELGVRRALGASLSSKTELLTLSCAKHLRVAWKEKFVAGSDPALGASSFVSFVGNGPPGFDFVFKNALANQPTQYVFIDATVSRLNHKLDTENDDSRKRIILGAMA